MTSMAINLGWQQFTPPTTMGLVDCGYVQSTDAVTDVWYPLDSTYADNTYDFAGAPFYLDPSDRFISQSSVLAAKPQIKKAAETFNAHTIQQQVQKSEYQATTLDRIKLGAAMLLSSGFGIVGLFSKSEDIGARQQIQSYSQLIETGIVLGDDKGLSKACYEYASFLWAHCRWREAEEVWNQAAYYECLQKGIEPTREDVVKILLKRKIITQNEFAGNMEGDEFIIVSELGSGTYGIVHKVYGRDVVVKIAIKPALFGGWPQSVLRVFEKEVVGMTTCVEQGIPVAKILAHGVGFMYKELINGPTLDQLELYELPEGGVAGVRSVFWEVVKQMDEAGLRRDRIGTNLVFSPELGAWFLVDWPLGEFKFDSMYEALRPYL